MNVLQAMLARRSCRDFTAEPVTEKEIEQLESDIKELEQESVKPDVVVDHIRLGEIFSEMEEKRKRLESATDEWLELSE